MSFPVTALSFAVALLFFGSGESFAAERVALVIGNGAYRNVSALPNPKRDAADVAESLKRLGFSVALLTDAGANDIRKALIEFGRDSQDSEMAVVYYAGHGMEMAGENWLIPVDAELRSEADTESEAVSLKALINQVSKARQLGLVILDACRNNSFGLKMNRGVRTRAVTRGLARIEPAENVLVAYAAKDGTTADDGDGRNSPFTKALLHHIETPGLEVSFLFRNVRDDVMAATKREQQPFVYGSLSKDAIYLKPPAAQSEAIVGPAADEVLWSTVQGSAVPEVYEEFIRRFPASSRTPEAKSKLAQLKTASLGSPASALSRSKGNPYFTEPYIGRINEIASRHRLAMPVFAIDAVDARVPAEFRRFVGVWASKVGYGGAGRQAALIVNSVDAEGQVSGYYIWGPSTKNSFYQIPAGYANFSTKVQGNRFVFTLGTVRRTVFLSGLGTIRIQDDHEDGRSASITQEPIWTLAEREAAARR